MFKVLGKCAAIRSCALWASAVLAGLLFVTGPANAQGPMKIRVSWVAVPNNLPPFMFKKAGIPRPDLVTLQANIDQLVREGSLKQPLDVKKYPDLSFWKSPSNARSRLCKEWLRTVSHACNLLVSKPLRHAGGMLLGVGAMMDTGTLTGFLCTRAALHTKAA